IDFEYADVGVKWYDIANFFNEMMGPDVDRKKMATKEVKEKFLRYYLEAANVLERENICFSTPVTKSAGSPMLIVTEETEASSSSETSGGLEELVSSRTEQILRTVEFYEEVSHLYWG